MSGIFRRGPFWPQYLRRALVFTTAAATFAASESDAIGLGDTPSTLHSIVASESDGIGLADTPSTLVAWIVSESDGVGLADTALAVHGFPAVESDGVGLGDSSSTLAAWIASESDSVGLADTPSTLAAWIVSESDGIGLADTSLAVHGFPSTESDGVGLGDSPSTLAAWITSESDGVGLADTPSTLVAWLSSESDGVGLGDTASTALGAAEETDSIGLGDTPSTKVAFIGSESDGVGLGSTVSTLAAWIASESDGVGLGDTATTTTTAAATVSGAYAPEHAGALADVRAAGSAVTFTKTTRTYTPTTGASTISTTTVAGVAIQTGGDPQQYADLGLIEVEAASLLFVPNTYGSFPALGATATWRGLNHVVRSVELLAPDATTILAFVVLQLQDSGTQDVSGSIYAPEHAGALADITAAGTAVTFSEDERTYTPGTPSTVTTTTVAGFAIRTRGNQKLYEQLGLVARDTVSLLFAGTTFGEVPSTGMAITWASIDYTVRDVRRIAPDGASIISRVVISL